MALNLCISLAQLNPLVGDLEGNSRQVLAAARQAAAAGVQVLVTPELALWGYPPRDLLLLPSLLRRQQKVLDALAQALPEDLRVLVGVVAPLADEGGSLLHNSAALVGDGAWRVVAAKRLLPSYDVFDERRYFRPGSQPCLVEIPLAGRPLRLAVTICEDLWADPRRPCQPAYDCDPVAELAPLAPDVMVNLSASPFAMGKQTLRRELATAAAARLGCPVAYVNQVGGNDELVFDGNSFVVDPQGAVVLQLPSARPATHWVHLALPQGLAAPPAGSPMAVTSPQEELWKVLVLGLGDYACKCGFRAAVLGLSGGVDSALVACLAAAALGPRQLRGLLMPSPFSSPGSVADARELAQRLGMATTTVPITPLMDTFAQALHHALGKDPGGVAAENLQSRIRGTLLMALANQEERLLLSTGNKSELAVGYCTLYGDMNGGLAVIGDLYKTDVYRLCRWLNSPAAQQQRHAAGLPTRGPLIPEVILSKPPSAELHPSQKDSDSLPDYAILDPILKRLVEQHDTPDQLIAAGDDPALVQSIWSLLRRAEFKRRQAPPVLKVSGRAFGTGWRMPIATC
ncbi:MAG: NAD synthetase [Candidatus Synechococcus spongiarum SP3]|uniref:Glutamine-dependent NAD(+) synthetase n=1 Tax=Candidatus Synechococcus spongiarum SP3 TaxID=1604020 RepID=A0A0G2HLZ4_9SYNE|nr:MAG: NAD synthetase [Candidatus Synechococcus spongiarum SP3]